MEDKVQLLECIPIETVCYMASFLDYYSLAKFLRTCKLLWGIRKDPILTTVLDVLILLKEESKAIDKQTISLVSRQFRNQFLTAEYMEVRSLNTSSMPNYLVVEESMAHKELLKAGCYFSKKAINIHIELHTHTDEYPGVSQLLDNAYFKASCATMVPRGDYLVPVHELGMIDPMDRYIAIRSVQILGTSSLAKYVTYDTLRHARNGRGLECRSERVNGRVEVSLYMRTNLVLVSRNPLSMKLEAIVSEVASDVVAMREQ